MKQIKFTDGCPNGCEYCYEPKIETKFYDPIIPEKGKDSLQRKHNQMVLFKIDPELK